MRYLRTNTATRITVGPFLDETNGVTPQTSLTVTNCKLTLMVDTGGVPTLVLDATATASGGDNDMVHVTNDDAGFYDLELTAAQTNYLGRAMLAITDAANHCPVFHECMILPANVYDSLVLGTDKLDTNTVEWLGTAAHAATVNGIPVVQLHNATTDGGVNAPDNFAGLSIKAGGDGGVKLMDDAMGGSGLTITVKTGEGTSGDLVALLQAIETDAATAGDTVSNATYGNAAIKTEVAGIATILSGITSLAHWLRGLFNKRAMNATAQTEIRDTTGTFDPATDSVEALRDRGDAAWTTAVVSGLSTFNAATDKVYLGNGAHGGSSMTITGKTMAFTTDTGDAVCYTSTDVGGYGLSAYGGGAKAVYIDGGIDADLVSINSTSVAGTGTQIASAFVKFLDVAAPTGTVNSLPDAVAGAANGLFIAGTNAATSITTGLTANITGNITGTLSTVTTLTNLPAITSNWLTAAGMNTDASAEIADAVWDELLSGHTGAGSAGKIVGDMAASAIADAVWDEILSGHAIVGSTGAAMSAASASGDPWATALPGSYGEGTAGQIIGQQGGSGVRTLTITVTDDGSTPIEGVRAWLTSDAAGAHIVRSGITGTLGVMDPAPSVSDGTYYLWVSGAGYDAPSAPKTCTVTVSATTFTEMMATATGGGTTSTGYMEYTPADVLATIKTYLGGSPSDATAMAHVVAGLKTVMDGVDPRTMRRHFWAFMEPAVSLVFFGKATGTMVVTGGTTIKDEVNSPFVSTMVGQTITADTSGNTYTIATYVSASQVTVTASATADNGDTYTLMPTGIYATPTGFRGIKEPPVFAYAATGERFDMVKTSPEDIRRMWRDDSDAGDTCYWALEPIEFDPTAGTSQAYRFLVAPVPDENMTATMRVQLRVADPASGRRFIGGDVVSFAIRNAALADAEIIVGRTEGVWAAAAKASLIAAIDADKSVGVTRKVESL